MAPAGTGKAQPPSRRLSSGSVTAWGCVLTQGPPAAPPSRVPLPLSSFTPARPQGNQSGQRSRGEWRPDRAGPAQPVNPSSEWAALQVGGGGREGPPFSLRAPRTTASLQREIQAQALCPFLHHLHPVLPSAPKSRGPTQPVRVCVCTHVRECVCAYVCYKECGDQEEENMDFDKQITPGASGPIPRSCAPPGGGGGPWAPSEQGRGSGEAPSMGPSDRPHWEETGMTGRAWPRGY